MISRILIRERQEVRGERSAMLLPIDGGPGGRGQVMQAPLKAGKDKATDVPPEAPRCNTALPTP